MMSARQTVMLLLALGARSGLGLSGWRTPSASPLLRAPSARAAPRPARMCAPALPGPEELTVTVRRGPNNALGLELSDANLVLLQLGQPELLVGDIIVGLNGAPLDGRYVGGVLDPAASAYEFAVSRRSAAAAPELELALRGFGAELFRPDVDAQEVDETLRARVARVLAALEAIGAATAPADPAEASLGFWKLLLCRGSSARSGLSGASGAIGCELVAHWQALGTDDPQAQVVEVIADPLLRRHTVAALKGTRAAADRAADGAAAAALAALAASGGPSPVCATTETYDRLEMNGSPMRSAPLPLGRACTYLSPSLRIVRFDSAAAVAAAAEVSGQGGAAVGVEGDGAAELEVAAYWRTTAEEAGKEIGRLAAAPLDSGGMGPDGADEELPLYERRRMQDAEFEAESSSIP